MPTTVDDLKGWFKDGKKEKNKYMIIVCDTFDHEDFPVYCKDKHQMESKKSYYTGKNMARVMEIYDLSIPFNKQPMNGRFAWAV